MGELDGAKGFVPCAYLEQAPTWMSEIPADGAKGVAAEVTPDQVQGRSPAGLKSVLPQSDRPDLAKAIKVHLDVFEWQGG